MWGAVSKLKRGRDLCKRQSCRPAFCHCHRHCDDQPGPRGGLLGSPFLSPPSMVAWSHRSGATLSEPIVVGGRGGPGGSLTVGREQIRRKRLHQPFQATPLTAPPPTKPRPLRVPPFPTGPRAGDQACSMGLWGRLQIQSTQWCFGNVEFRGPRGGDFPGLPGAGCGPFQVSVHRDLFPGPEHQPPSLPTWSHPPNIFRVLTNI